MNKGWNTIFSKNEAIYNYLVLAFIQFTSHLKNDVLHYKTALYTTKRPERGVWGCICLTHTGLNSNIRQFIATIKIVNSECHDLGVQNKINYVRYESNLNFVFGNALGNALGIPVLVWNSIQKFNKNRVKIRGILIWYNVGYHTFRNSLYYVAYRRDSR